MRDSVSEARTREISDDEEALPPHDHNQSNIVPETEQMVKEYKHLLIAEYEVGAFFCETIIYQKS